MRSQLKFVITAVCLCHLFLGTPLVTSQALPDPAASSAQQTEPQTGFCHLVLTAPPTFHKEDGKDSSAEKKQPRIPISEAEPVKVSARECEKNGDQYALHGDVEVEFGEFTFHGQTVTYDASTGEATASGGASLDGGTRDMHIAASHANYNIRTRTGKFYDVTGTTGARFKGRNVTLTSSSPIAFTGKMVEQTGPDEYVLHGGSVTSCEMPHPKWTFNAAKIILRVGQSAKVYNTTFRLKGVPVIYLPYVAPPVERLGRQSGFLIPNVGTSSTKGTIVGDSFYWAINRSADATVGGEYLSKRGWSLQENFRAKPSDTSYLNLNYFQVLDRGIASKDANGNPTTADQGGEDIKLNGEALFPHGVRGVASLDYLSSFVFRLAFTENFSQAVDSEVKSVAFLSKSVRPYSLNLFGSRYQNFQSTNNGDVITILHTPGLEFSAVDQPIFGSPVYGSFDVDAEGLRRSEPGFVTPGVVGRFDLDPVLSLPIFTRGWTFRPEVQLRNTVYTQEQVPNAAGQTSPEHNVLDRRTIEGDLELRPPALAKVFSGTVFGNQVKHTIEPRMTYRYTNGVEDFTNIIRFDFRDVLSNTNEVEYALMQRLFLKGSHPGCAQESPAAGAKNQQSGATTQPEDFHPADCLPAGADEFLTWEVKQKYFIDPDFGGAVINGRRNVLYTTVGFTGIAFLTDPRRFSPVVSRLRLRTTGNSDLEWQLDYDTKKGRINASTVYSTLHFGNFFVEGSHAYLQVPGEVVVNPNPATAVPLGSPLPILPQCPLGHFNQKNPCVPPLFNQFRALVGYGSPSKRGWSAAANVGVDSEFNLVQYSAAQSAYNWDCCGLSFEYRRFSLGQVRNENQYRFAFTLANIGSFGNLKRQTRLF
jgi:LPS-assembly protein